MYSGTSLLRSPMGLSKSELQVTVLTGLFSILFTIGNYMGLSEGDSNSEVTVLVR